MVAFPVSILGYSSGTCRVRLYLWYPENAHVPVLWQALQLLRAKTSICEMYAFHRVCHQLGYAVSETLAVLAPPHAVMNEKRVCQKRFCTNVTRLVQCDAMTRHLGKKDGLP